MSPLVTLCIGRTISSACACCVLCAVQWAGDHGRDLFTEFSNLGMDIMHLAEWVAESATVTRESKRGRAPKHVTILWSRKVKLELWTHAYGVTYLDKNIQSSSLLDLFKRIYHKSVDRTSRLERTWPSKKELLDRCLVRAGALSL